MAHGICKTCPKVVDVIVERDQVLDGEEFICVECKIARILAHANARVESLRDKARKLRDASQLKIFEEEKPAAGKSAPAPAVDPPTRRPRATARA